MIDIREIRVGNCFNIKNSKEVVFVDSILSLDKEILYSTWHDEKHNYADVSYLIPIPISVEILLGLGFKKEFHDILKEFYYRLRLNGFCIDINKYSNTLGRDYGK